LKENFEKKTTLKYVDEKVQGNRQPPYIFLIHRRDSEMKKASSLPFTLLCSFLLLTFSCATGNIPSPAGTAEKPPQAPMNAEAEPKIAEIDILYYPFTISSPCDTFAPGDAAAKIESVVAFHVKDGLKQPLPPRLSGKHHEALMKARELYSRKQYEEAAALLQPALRDEPGNVFVLNETARVLFRLEESKMQGAKGGGSFETNRQSFELYRKLIALLDKKLCEQAAGSGKRIVPVDMWFVEAYWKLGNLYMDRREYEKAVYEITRGVIVGLKSLNPKDQTIIEQAYSYLCEAYFHLGNFHFARFFAQKALGINPRNTHVRPFLDGMKK